MRMKIKLHAQIFSFTSIQHSFFLCREGWSERAIYCAKATLPPPPQGEGWGGGGYYTGILHKFTPIPTFPLRGEGATSNGGTEREYCAKATLPPTLQGEGWGGVDITRDIARAHPPPNLPPAWGRRHTNVPTFPFHEGEEPYQMRLIYKS